MSIRTSYMFERQKQRKNPSRTDPDHHARCNILEEPLEEAESETTKESSNNLWKN
jgi:hypothetical protein